VNHVNDVIQTFIRPTAGAILFAASANVVTEINPILSIAAGLLIAGGVHAVKAAAVRPAVTATTAGAGNVPVSIAEDILSTVMSVLSIVLPILMAVILVLIGILLIVIFTRRAQRRDQSS
jgi:phage-related minor tail protein